MADESFESNQTTEDILKKLEKYGKSKVSHLLWWLLQNDGQEIFDEFI